jgi:DNA-binding response OmpR family regulator
MKRILLVDDESDICFVLEKVLGQNGFVVDSYENPMLALEKFKAQLYDLVVLDIKMPELNGFALYRQIKKWNHYHKVGKNFLKTWANLWRVLRHTMN